MPAVKKGEKQSDYVSRCVAYVVKNEGLNQQAALGKCYGLYKESKKRKKSQGSTEEPEWTNNDLGDFTFLP